VHTFLTLVYFIRIIIEPPQFKKIIDDLMVVPVPYVVDQEAQKLIDFFFL
jgi:hypothetical protein